MTVDYTPGMPELVSYAAHKRRRGRIGEDTETTDEALSFQSRQAKSRAMKKNKAKIAMGRRRAMKKAPTKDRIEKRAQRAAIKQIFTKLSKGKPKSEVPYAMRQSIEKRIAKMKGKVSSHSERNFLPDIRQKAKDQTRLEIRQINDSFV